MFDLKILYAEDNKKIRDSYALVLKRYFKEVIEACDGKEALDLYEQHKPHIVLTDINMPFLDGLELVKLIRQNDTETKIIVLSAYSDQEKLMKAIPLGLSAYLVKPIKGDAFKQVVLDAASSLDKSGGLKLSDAYVFDKEVRKLLHKNEVINLTNQECTILTILTENMPTPVSSESIAFTLWDEYDEKSYAKIQNVIKRLRKKAPELIESVYGFGYKVKN